MSELPITTGTPGQTLPMVIDGIPFRYFPQNLEPTPRDTSVLQEMAAGRRRVWTPRNSFDGIPDESSPFEISFLREALHGDDLTSMRRIRSRGGLHAVTLWTRSVLTYTLPAGVQRLYLPYSRRCSPHLYSGLRVMPDREIEISTTLLPTTATLNGEDLSVTYATGPSLDDPGDGGLVIARNPETSGAERDYVPMLLGDEIAHGDVVEVWSFFTLMCHLQVNSIRVDALRENHAYTFVEV